MSLLQSDQAIAPRQLSGSKALWRHPIFQCAVIVIVFFAAVAPTLPWVDFSGGMENFNVGTALEMVRDGHWIIPTLNGEVRTRKPPLAEWTTAWGIMSSNSLAWGARWPTLLAGCLMLVGVYELGRLTGGIRLGLTSALVCGSSALFLKWAREASYDMQLALWVTVCNVFLARAVLLGQWWLGCCGGGIALGLALMTKGPPAILQTIVPPVVLFCLMWPSRSPRFSPPGTAALGCVPRNGGQPSTFGRTQPRTAVPQDTQPWAAVPQNQVMPVLAGVLLTLAIALPWTLYVMSRFPGRVAEWSDEVLLSTEARFEHRIGGWFAYFILVPLMLPWTVWFLWGLGTAARQWLEDWRSKSLPPAGGERFALRLMFVWFSLPLVVMWFFPERRDRYALPLLGPAGVLSAWALLRYLDALRADATTAHWPLAAHWACVGAIGIGLPIAGACAPWLRTAEGGPWFSPAVAAAAAAVGLVLLIVSMSWKPRTVGLVGGTVAIMLAALPLFVSGYARSAKGRSESKPFVQAILRRYPDAVVYNATNRSRRADLPLEMLIYLNRVPARLEHPDTLAATDRPQVIVFPDGTCNPPADFIRAAPRMQIKGEWWNAFALPARSGT